MIIEEGVGGFNNLKPNIEEKILPSWDWNQLHLPPEQRRVTWSDGFQITIKNKNKINIWTTKFSGLELNDDNWYDLTANFITTLNEYNIYQINFETENNNEMKINFIFGDQPLATSKKEQLLNIITTKISNAQMPSLFTLSLERIIKATSIVISDEATISNFAEQQVTITKLLNQQIECNLKLEGKSELARRNAEDIFKAKLAALCDILIIAQEENIILDYNKIEMSKERINDRELERVKTNILTMIKLEIKIIKLQQELENNIFLKENILFAKLKSYYNNKKEQIIITKTINEYTQLIYEIKTVLDKKGNLIEIKSVENSKQEMIIKIKDHDEASNNTKEQQQLKMSTILNNLLQSAYEEQKAWFKRKTIKNPSMPNQAPLVSNTNNDNNLPTTSTTLTAAEAEMATINDKDNNLPTSNNITGNKKEKININKQKTITNDNSSRKLHNSLAMPKKHKSKKSWNLNETKAVKQENCHLLMAQAISSDDNICNPWSLPAPNDEISTPKTRTKHKHYHDIERDPWSLPHTSNEIKLPATTTKENQQQCIERDPWSLPHTSNEVNTNKSKEQKKAPTTMTFTSNKENQYENEKTKPQTPLKKSFSGHHL